MNTVRGSPTGYSVGPERRGAEESRSVSLESEGEFKVKSRGWEGGDKVEETFVVVDSLK